MSDSEIMINKTIQRKINRMKRDIRTRKTDPRKTYLSNKKYSDEFLKFKSPEYDLLKENFCAAIPVKNTIAIYLFGFHTREMQNMHLNLAYFIKTNVNYSDIILSYINKKIYNNFVSLKLEYILDVNILPKYTIINTLGNKCIQSVTIRLNNDIYEIEKKFIKGPNEYIRKLKIKKNNKDYVYISFLLTIFERA